MNYDLKRIRLDRLNIPIETLRKSAFPASDEKLRESIKRYGLLVPLIVTPLGRGEYSVWDGTRRTKALKELGTSGSFKISALVTKGTDAESVLAQMNINQNRERLNSFAEAEALRQLVVEHSMPIGEAGKKLLKSSSWATKVLKIFDLPEDILYNFHAGRIILSQAIVLSKYSDKQSIPGRENILKVLYEEALKGVSASDLKALALKSKGLSDEDLEKYKPKLYKAGTKSWVRVKPLQRGVNFNIHLGQSDDTEKMLEQFEQIVQKLKDS